MSEVHFGVCGAHQSGPNLYVHLKRLGYYLPTMIHDCTEFAKRCQVCQDHGKFVNAVEPLHAICHSRLFTSRRIDIVESFEKAIAREYSDGNGQFL